MIIKQQKVRAMKDNNVSFLSFSPTFSSSSGVTYQSFENNQVAGGRRGRWGGGGRGGGGGWG